MIITISREFGSGGRELGKRLADILGYKYYDKDSVIRLAKNVNTPCDDTAVYPYVIHNTFLLYTSYSRPQTSFLNVQQKTIREIAKQDNCIFIGRGADVILKDINPIKIFVYAEKEAKIQRCLLNAPEGESLTAKQYAQKMKRIDKSRKKTYAMLGGDNWGKKENYDMIFNTSDVEIKKLAPIVAELINLYGSKSNL